MAFIPPDRVSHSFVRSQGEAVLPADFGEYAGAAAAAFLYNDRSISRPMNMASEYRSVMDAYKRVTGKAFTYTGRNGRGRQAQVTDAVPMSGDSYASFWDQMQIEMEANPELAEQLGATRHYDIMQRVYTQAKQLEAQRNDFASRASGMAALGGIAGEIAAVVTDPVIAASMVLAAPVSSGILSGMIIEAGIAGGAEALVQPIVQRFRGEAGLEAGFGKGVENVLTAATAGGAFYGAFRVAGAGANQLVEYVRGNGQTRGAIDPDEMTDRQRAALLELEKAAELERRQPIGRPTPEDHAAHIRRVEEARLALVQGRAVNVGVEAHTLDLGMETISLNTLAKRMRSLETVGLDLEEIAPNLGKFLDRTNNGLEAIIARDRVDGVVRELRQATAEMRPVLEAVQASETRLADVLDRLSANTDAQIRAAMQGRQQVPEGLIDYQTARGALDEADRLRADQLRQDQQTATSEALRRSARVQEQRLLDKGRKRVQRERERMRQANAGLDAEIQRLEAEAAELEAERALAVAERDAAGEALLAARRRQQEATGQFNERIASALSNEELKRLNKEHLLRGGVHGELPPGQARRAANANAELARLTEEQSGMAPARIMESRMAELEDAAVARLPDEAVIETADGRFVSPRDAVREMQEELEFLEELKRCQANANSP